MIKHSFNPIHKEHLNKLSEIAQYYEKYSIEFAHANGGVPNDKFGAIYHDIVNVTYGIIDVISYEIQENEFYKIEKERSINKI